MSILNLTNIKKSFSTEVILNGISASLERGEKIALVGQNGIGKSTLLKIIGGELTDDGGLIVRPPDVKTAYLPQNLEVHFNVTVTNFISYSLGTSDWPYTFKIILSGLGLDKLNLDRPISTLSSGEQSKVALAVTLIKEADLLLLDEPTNNLDLPTIIWLTEYLKGSTAAAIIVSHDRTFLDQLVREIWSLDTTTRKLVIQKGNYSQYLDNEIKKIKEAEKLYLNQETKVAQLRIDVARNYARMRAGQKWVGNDNDKMLRGYYRNKAGKSGRRAEIVTKRINRITIHQQPIVKEPVNIAFQAGGSDYEFKLDKVTFVNPPIKLGPISWSLTPGEKILIIGENGMGKSTLLKLLGGDLKPTAGKRLVGENLVIGHLDQLQNHLLKTDTPLSYFKSLANLTAVAATDFLKSFRINDNDLKRTIDKLSPGTRMKLVLATLTLNQVNCLLLDEPTSHLDLDATVALGEGLSNYDGSLIVVSHDLSFINSLQFDRVFLLDDGILTQVKNLDYYLQTAKEKAKRLLRIIK